MIITSSVSLGIGLILYGYLVYAFITTLNQNTLKTGIKVDYLNILSHYEAININTLFKISNSKIENYLTLDVVDLLKYFKQHVAYMNNNPNISRQIIEKLFVKTLIFSGGIYSIMDLSGESISVNEPFFFFVSVLYRMIDSTQKSEFNTVLGGFNESRQ
ncbi:hypothetical protein V2E24_01510 [Mycoplasmopsis ciconiae]|uniref:Uncharacterized protein n=1 Tax=Mycoplasmopsis ciconiae TaxID=561067 RepID=A0ABU7MLV7_9BACT|nr:hypothetical protein [Mycoplasmopsis ciconiae]